MIASAKPMLPENPDGAGLRTFVSCFFGEDHPHPRLELPEGVVENAVAIEVDLATINGFEKSISIFEMHLTYGSRRLRRMRLDLTLHVPDRILKLSPGPVEGIVDGEGGIGETLVFMWCSIDGNLTSSGQNQMDVDLVLSTCSLMLTGSFHHHATGHDAIEELL